MLVFVFISFIRIFGQYVFVFSRYSVGIVFWIAQSNAFTWSFLSLHSSTDHFPVFRRSFIVIFNYWYYSLNISVWGELNERTAHLTMPIAIFPFHYKNHHFPGESLALCNVILVSFELNKKKAKNSTRLANNINFLQLFRLRFEPSVQIITRNATKIKIIRIFLLFLTLLYKLLLNYHANVDAGIVAIAAVAAVVGASFLNYRLLEKVQHGINYMNISSDDQRWEFLLM